MISRHRDWRIDLCENWYRHRFALLHAAYWFYASYRKDDAERTTFYRVQALGSIQALKDNAELSVEPDVNSKSQSDSGFIGMPFGYPNMHA